MGGKRIRKDNSAEIPGFEVQGVNSKRESFVPTTKGKNKFAGGFDSMGLSHNSLMGIHKCGYKRPTHIQRKTIPLLLEGRDVVAMAKTGSGKTASFLIPMFEKLKLRNPTKGARALILSPTRELAVQTYKFIRDLGKAFDFKTALVLGGDSMDSQFSAMHTSPDIIVGTPGRFVHLCVEMDLKLSSIEYVVFDEADRLFEMGFLEQLKETLTRLPNSRQTVMFSATLPKLMVDFAKAGLSDPTLIRLDVGTKLPDDLTLKFVYCRPDERYSALVSLLKTVIPTDAQTVVFVASQHHVELMSYILNMVNISNTMIYSSMDPSARKINLAKFICKKASVLIVTDIAARGIDIPNLDYVINVHFPGKPKLFIHRVGRCARAGRPGTAYSIFSGEDTAHLLDLYLFLNKSFNTTDNMLIGKIPEDILEEEHNIILGHLKSHHVASIYKTSENAYKKYISSRPVASVASNKRVKSIDCYSLRPLDVFIGLKKENDSDDSEIAGESAGKHQIKEKGLGRFGEEKHNIMLQIRNFRPPGTIFELNPHKKSVQMDVMKNKRSFHSVIISKHRTNLQESKSEDKQVDMKAEQSNTSNILQDVNHLEKHEKLSSTLTQGKKRKLEMRDPTHYISYQPDDTHTERGFAVNNFDYQAQNASFSIMDKNEHAGNVQRTKKWDRIKKKMVSVKDPHSGKIRTESGLWIAATYKTGRYEEWKEKMKIEGQRTRNSSEATPFSHKQQYVSSRHARHNAKVEAKKYIEANPELKNSEQIAKRRLRVEAAKKRELQNKAKKLESHTKRNKRKVRK